LNNIHNFHSSDYIFFLLFVYFWDIRLQRISKSWLL